MGVTRLPVLGILSKSNAAFWAEAQAEHGRRPVPAMGAQEAAHGVFLATAAAVTVGAPKEEPQ